MILRLKKKFGGLLDVIKDDHIDLIPIVTKNKQVVKIISKNNYKKIFKK